MSKWADRYNQFPPDVRHVGAMLECELRIQHLIFEKKRLRARLKQSIKEIDDHIKYCQQTLDS